jgi:SAM-dependent methyltransferase/uncharacterized protein YbaR (Trm112 family)
LDTSTDTALWELLCCPRCAGKLEPAAVVSCSACGTRYPFVDGIPWLFAEPEAARGEWLVRLREFTTELETQAARYRAALEEAASRPVARSRLKLLSSACSDHARRLRSLLAPLDAAEPLAAAETYRALVASLPASQGLTSYYANLHRDWCWGAEENEAAFSAIDAALGAADPGRVLVVGAGAGRLAYDVHARRRPAALVAADLNPLMMIVARRMFSGGRVHLYEFPVAPRDLASHAVLRDLRAPSPAAPGLYPVLADASRAPFATGAFDTVITPWLIDVLDEDLATFAARLNQWLRPGGRWLNSGSFFPQHPEPARCYSIDELPVLLAAAGFVDVEVSEQRMPYLASPASRHGRLESVVTFSAVAGSRPAAPPPHRATPEWLVNEYTPVPRLPQVESEALAMRVHTFVASLIDGTRSLRDIASVLVEQRLMVPDEARPAVREFLRRMYASASAPRRP